MKITIAIILFPLLFLLAACETATEKFPLHSINLNGEKSSSGSFFLIYGSYESEEYSVYNFYAEDNEGVIQHYTIPAEEIRIILKDIEPYIECTRSWGDPHGVRSYDDVVTWGDLENCNFYLPEDSIGGEVDIKVK